MIPRGRTFVDGDRDLELLEAELKPLEAEYNMFFAGRLPRPPWKTRGRVDALVKRLDRMCLSNYHDRFRFTSLQSRFATCVDLWDCGFTAREGGRPGPFTQPRPMAEKAPRASDRILAVTTFSDLMRDGQGARSARKLCRCTARGPAERPQGRR